MLPKKLDKQVVNKTQIAKWIESGLSKEQREPFEHPTTNTNILASAGSGKTRTLVHLLGNDLANGIPPSSIIAFTFTEKAAEELLSRIHLLVKENLPDINLTGIYIGTIHAWCLKHLAKQSNFYNFTPIDELAIDALISRLYDTLNLESAYHQPYPKAIPQFLADVEVFYNENLSLTDIPIIIRPSIEKFLDILQKNRLMTFGGMIQYAIEALKQSGQLTDLKALYVDEYQDVNPSQVELIKAMLPFDGKLTVVGDDLQCIYQWRGSDVSRIINFSTEFSDPAVHRLTTNHRSRPSIVNLGNQIAKNITMRDVKKIMNPGRDEAETKSVYWISCASEEKQAAAVARILKKMASNGVHWNKMAVLLRSILGSGQTFIDEFYRQGIPTQCPILSRGGEFIDEFVLPVFNWLRDEHRPPRNEIEEAEAETSANDLWATVKPWLNDNNAENIFWKEINEWQDSLDAKKSTAYNVRSHFYNFLDKCNVYLEPDDYNLMVGLGITSQIIRSVEEIHRRRLKEQGRRAPRGIISEIFFALQRNHQRFGESLPINTDVDAVLISTVHQAKGLEWPVVILPMLSAKRFPVGSKQHGTSYSDVIASRYGTTEEDERRLFYVAVTRARERLFLLDPNQQTPNRRSVFLKEINQQTIILPEKIEDIAEPAFTIAPEDLKDVDPPPVKIGLSDLLIYLECPYQYGLRRIVGIQPSVGDELGFGQGLHELIQRRFESESPWSNIETKKQVDEHVNLPYMSENEENRARQAIEKRLHALDNLAIFNTKVESEIEVEVLFDGGIVHGIIDSLQPKEDGTYLIRDWKSNIHDDFLSRYTRQLQFYVFALGLLGKNVSEADLVDIAKSTNTGKVSKKRIDIRKDSINRFVKELEHALKSISAGDFSPTPNSTACKSCDMYRICAVRVNHDTAD